MRVTPVLTAATLILASCVAPERHVALFYYNGEDPYIASFVTQIEEETAGTFRLDGYDGLNSQILQNEQIEAVLDDEPDLIIVNPVDRLGAYAIIRSLAERDIPVIFFNREPLARDLALWDRAYYVGARAEQSARLQAQLVIDLFGGDAAALNGHDKNGDGRIQTIILKGEQGHQDAEIRTSEVLRSFEERGFVLEVLTVHVADWDRTEAYDAMRDLLREHGAALELVISNNDAMALGAISRMRQDGYFADDNGNGRIDSGAERWLPVVGIDGIDGAVEQIEEGYLYGTVVNDSQRMAEAIAELAEVIIAGRETTDLSVPLTEGTYVWVDYRPFVFE
ncbi:MAG: galactose ABC transporter substrate-binding protein [Spirochaetales bacterium]|nr:galactose ABC transporter substrate-binding protein [Spirochaetales bacterium]